MLAAYLVDLQVAVWEFALAVLFVELAFEQGTGRVVDLVPAQGSAAQETEEWKQSC